MDSLFSFNLQILYLGNRKNLIIIRTNHVQTARNMMMNGKPTTRRDTDCYHKVIAIKWPVHIFVEHIHHLYAMPTET